MTQTSKKKIAEETNVRMRTSRSIVSEGCKLPSADTGEIRAIWLMTPDATPEHRPPKTDRSPAHYFRERTSPRGNHSRILGGDYH